MDPILKAHQLNKIFSPKGANRFHALKDVDFSIAPGEFVAIMGPSGSGKSTLLTQVSGMDRPTSGTVTLGKDLLQEKSERDLANTRLYRMGFVFQKSHLLKDLSLFDNVVLPGFTARKMPRTQVVHRAKKLFQDLGIDHIAHHQIHQASGGQLQRACIARALINDPDILFGDEPTGALDSTSSKEVMDIFSRLNQEGATVMLVTHDARVAARAHRVLVMVDGRIHSEKSLGPMTPSASPGQREEDLQQWLHGQGL